MKERINAGVNYEERMEEYEWIWRQFKEDNFKVKRDNDLVNHVKMNVELSGKINKIRDIQLFYRNFTKEQEI